MTHSANSITFEYNTDHDYIFCTRFFIDFMPHFQNEQMMDVLLHLIQLHHSSCGIDRKILIHKATVQQCTVGYKEGGQNIVI